MFRPFRFFPPLAHLQCANTPQTIQAAAEKRTAQHCAAHLPERHTSKRFGGRDMSLRSV
jgi:hypothetical protein